MHLLLDVAWLIDHVDGGVAVLSLRDVIHLIRLILQAIHLLHVLPAVPAP